MPDYKRYGADYFENLNLLNKPEFILIGGAVRLCSLGALARQTGVPYENLHNMMWSLGVPLVRFEENGPAYLNLPTFEFALLQLLRPGSLGWNGHPRDKGKTIGTAVRAWADDSGLRGEYEWLCSIYGVLDQRQTEYRLEKIARHLKRARSRMDQKARENYKTYGHNWEKGHPLAPRERPTSNPRKAYNRMKRDLAKRQEEFRNRASELGDQSLTPARIIPPPPPTS